MADQCSQSLDRGIALTETDDTAGRITHKHIGLALISSLSPSESQKSCNSRWQYLRNMIQIMLILKRLILLLFYLISIAVCFLLAAFLLSWV